MMNEVWLCEERHGDVYLWSTRTRADAWLEEQIDHNGGRPGVDDIEEHRGKDRHYVYFYGDFVASIERKVIDNE